MTLRVLLLSALLGVASFASAQNIDYRLHTQTDIMDRLKLAAKKNDLREQRLKDLFAQEGCTADRFTEQPVKHAKLPNLICTLPGETDSVILVTAHFDKVSEGMGVTDNWSGASLLPSLLYSIEGVPRHHTYVFIGFTNEEEGMVGSHFYADHLPPEQRAKIQAVINMDTLGLGPTEVWQSHADEILVTHLANVSNTLRVPLQAVNVENVGSTDSESFEKYNIPRMTIHSLTQQTLSILHSDRDQMSVIKPDDYYNTYKLLSAFLAYLDLKLTPPQSPTIHAAN